MRFRHLADDDLGATQDKINGRPLKLRNWMSPS